MPTYEYECRSCHRRFERFQSMTARPSAVCPRCKKAARRLISAGGGLLFKGSGFYITDHRSASYKKQAQEDSPPKGKADSAQSVADKGPASSQKKTK